MTNIEPLKFPVLKITGENYIVWRTKVELHLELYELSDTIKEKNTSSPQEKAKTIILIRKHLDENLIHDYGNLKDPAELWQALKEWFDHVMTITLPHNLDNWVQGAVFDLQDDGPSNVNYGLFSSRDIMSRGGYGGSRSGRRGGSLRFCRSRRGAEGGSSWSRGVFRGSYDDWLIGGGSNRRSSSTSRGPLSRESNQMENVEKLKFPALKITGENYIVWSTKVKIYLDLYELSETIKEKNTSSPQEKAKAIILIRKHLDENLMHDYGNLRDPAELWQALKEWFDNLMTITIPHALDIWVQGAVFDLQDDGPSDDNYGRFSSRDRSLRGGYRGSRSGGRGGSLRGLRSRRGVGRGSSWSRGGGGSRGSSDDWLIGGSSNGRSSSSSRGPPSRERSFGGSCFICGKSGHRATDCPGQRAF